MQVDKVVQVGFEYMGVLAVSHGPLMTSQLEGTHPGIPERNVVRMGRKTYNPIAYIFKHKIPRILLKNIINILNREGRGALIPGSGHGLYTGYHFSEVWGSQKRM